MIYANDKPKKGKLPKDNKEAEPKPQDIDPKENDKFSPGEPDGYNAEEFSTD